MACLFSTYLAGVGKTGASLASLKARLAKFCWWRLPLRMRQVIPLRVVQGQAQFTFIRTKVVLHKVRVFIEIHGLQGELPQSLSVRSRLACSEDCNPPPPCFELTRSWSNIVAVAGYSVFERWRAARRRRAGLPPVRVSARCVGALRGDGDGLHCCGAQLGRAAAVGAGLVRLLAYKQSCPAVLACPL